MTFNTAPLLAAILLTLGATASAMDVKTYREMKTSSEQSVRTYIHGLGAGMFITNVALQAGNQPRLFCPPDNLPVNESNYVDILDAQMALEAGVLPKVKFG